jgi:drug/metabolite transporter (DMT)-like permease
MGAFLCLFSAAAFGCMAIFGKLAYDAGVDVGELLVVRFGLAALVLAVVAFAVGQAQKLGRRAVVAGLLMGGVGYATQAGLYFLALERMDASLLSLVLYTYPVLVTVAAVVIGREKATRARVAALVVASAGTALVLLGAGTGALDPLATVMALGASVAYTVYILCGDRAVAGVPPVALASLVTAGATVTFGIVLVATTGPALSFGAEGWLWATMIALVSTVGAILAFFAGLARVGPSSAAILSTFEPLVTIVLAGLTFGEVLSPVQVLGGLLVLGTVVALSLSGARARPVASG